MHQKNFPMLEYGLVLALLKLLLQGFQRTKSRLTPRLILVRNSVQMNASKRSKGPGDLLEPLIEHVIF